MGCRHLSEQIEPGANPEANITSHSFRSIKVGQSLELVGNPLTSKPTKTDLPGVKGEIIHEAI